MFRMLPLVLSIAGLGCGQPAAIFEAPPQEDLGPAVQQQLTPCNDNKPCPAGQICVDDLCKPDDGTVVTPDVPDTPDTTNQPPDIPATPDPGPATPDPGPATPDPGKDTKPQVDPEDLKCPIPGKFGTEVGCGPIEACRIVDNGGTDCITSTVANPYKSPCQSHDTCDLLYGCHHGICTTYCELQFGDANCFDGAKCLTVGHPTFGACKP